MIYRRYAYGCDQGVWPRRMAYLQAKPELSAARLDSTVGRARERGGRAPKKGDVPPSVAAGAASAPRSTSWWINGDAPCVWA